MNGFNWLSRLMVFSFVSTVAVGSGWGSLLDLSSSRSVVEAGFQEFYELSGGRSTYVRHAGLWNAGLWNADPWNAGFNSEPSVEVHSGNCGIPSAPGSTDEPQSPPENRFQIGHHPVTGLTGRSNVGNGASGNAGGGVLSGQMVWVAGTPVSDWLMSRVLLIWRSPPVWERLKVPIC